MPLFVTADVSTAQTDTPECETPGELPAPLAGWSDPGALKAAGNFGAARRAELTPGGSAVLTLLPTPQVRYPVRPEKPGGTVSYGGVLRFSVAEEGLWRVALSTGAWVDVVKDGKASTSVAHGRGPPCTGIRKMVDYRLAPGTYALQVAANGSETMTLMVARLP
ncbi:hypothetical protein [Sphingopyxis sp.]|uniref:hypothetical protein n=1 Tax=Sphingopyxis sp. TaxID=1908224 RepID=UPI002D78E7A4|nr:hypothetical protein [Sphingopyxis sp.]HET6527011.1 hypothetical protein [Sphingopyxis sp.]